MSYEVRFEGSALIELDGLPESAFDALIDRVTDLVEEPWDAQAVGAPGRAGVLAQFGEYGLLAFVVDEAAQEISIVLGAAVLLRDLLGLLLRFGAQRGQRVVQGQPGADR